MSTEIARVEPGYMSRFGSERDIQNFMRRTAAIFKIPEEDLARPDVQASLQKATQYCVTYGYIPGIHVHMIPFNEKVKIPHPQNPAVEIEKSIRVYAPDLGEKAWKDSADRICQMLRISYVVDTQAMTTEEVRIATAAIVGQEFHPSDAGCLARVYRSDHNELFKSVGRQYNPEWVAGFWRMKKDRWGKPDTLPNGNTPADVARRRATKKALMAVFHLVPLDEYTEAQRFCQLSAYVETASAEALPPSRAELALPVDARSRYYRDSEGEIWEGDTGNRMETWESQKPLLVAEERAKMATEPAPTITSLVDVDAADWGSAEFDANAAIAEEFDDLPSVPAGMTSSAHTAAQTEDLAAFERRLEMLRKSEAPATNGQPNSRSKMHAILGQMDGGIADKDGFRHYLVGVWSNGQHSATSELTDFGPFIEWLELLKKNRQPDHKLSTLRAEFQAQAAA